MEEVFSANAFFSMFIRFDNFVDVLTKEETEELSREKKVKEEVRIHVCIFDRQLQAPPSDPFLLST